jgi:hypothetical protein
MLNITAKLNTSISEVIYLFNVRVIFKQEKNMNVLG